MAETIRPRTLFDTLSITAEQSGSVRARVESVIDRLVGSMPQDPSGHARPMPSGLFEQGSESVLDIKDNLDRIVAALARLESALPEERANKAVNVGQMTRGLNQATAFDQYTGGALASR